MTDQGLDFGTLSLDAIPALVSFFDAGHVCRYANAHHRHWYGRTPEDLTGRHMREFLGDEAYASRQPYLARVAAGETVSFETTVPHHDGSWRDATVRYVPHRSATGIDGFFILVVDLAPQLHRYHRVFDATAVAFWEIDLADVHAWLASAKEAGIDDPIAFIRANPDFNRTSLDHCKVLDVNSRAEEMFGVSRAEAIATPFGKWCPPESEKLLEDNLVAYLTGARGFEGETVMTRADGTRFPVHISTAFPKQVVANPAGTFAIMDISERVAREQALARANADLVHAARVAALGELTASIAHEVNQPLGAVSANGMAALRWIGRDQPDLGEATAAINRMINEAGRASEIIARTRRLATKGTGDRTRLSPNAVVEESAAITRWQLASLGAELSIVLAPEVPDIVADRVQLQQVLINLLVNAAQAMADAGSSPRRVEVSTRVEPGQIVIEVADTGPGISDEQGEQLFNAFYTTKPDGMGMGLSVAKTIVEAHGGRIAARGNAEGGATFGFTLPVGDAEPR